MQRRSIRRKLQLAVLALPAEVAVQERQTHIPGIVVVLRIEPGDAHRIQHRTLRAVTGNPLPVARHPLRPGNRRFTVRLLDRNRRLFRLPPLFGGGVFRTVEPHPPLQLPARQHYFAIGFIGVRAARPQSGVIAFRHRHPVQSRCVTGIGNVGLKIECRIEKISHRIAYIDGRHKRQHECTARPDPPVAEHQSEIRIRRINIEPISGGIENPRDADRGIEQKTGGFIPGPLPFGPAETAERMSGKLQILADIVKMFDHRTGQDGRVNPSHRIRNPDHHEIGHAEHRPVEPFNRISSAQLIGQFRRRPRPRMDGSRTDFFRGSPRGRASGYPRQQTEQHRQQQGKPDFPRFHGIAAYSRKAIHFLLQNPS